MQHFQDEIQRLRPDARINKYKLAYEQRMKNTENEIPCAYMENEKSV